MFDIFKELGEEQRKEKVMTNQIGTIRVLNTLEVVRCPAHMNTAVQTVSCEGMKGLCSCPSFAGRDPDGDVKCVYPAPANYQYCNCENPDCQGQRRHAYRCHPGTGSQITVDKIFSLWILDPEHCGTEWTSAQMALSKKISKPDDLPPKAYRSGAHKIDE